MSTQTITVLIIEDRRDQAESLKDLLAKEGLEVLVATGEDPAELAARIKAAASLCREEERQHTLVFGRLAIDLDTRQVTVDGRPVTLTKKEFDLLRTLAEHPGQVYTTEMLFRKLWGEYGERHTVQVHIGRLRDKIERDPSVPQYIVTVWGLGYRFDPQAH